MAVCLALLLAACGQADVPTRVSVDGPKPAGPSLSDVANGLTRHADDRASNMMAELDPAIHGAYALTPMTKGAFARLEAAWAAYDPTIQNGPVYEAFAEWVRLARAIERGEAISSGGVGARPKRAIQMIAAGCAAIAMPRLSKAEGDDRNEISRLAKAYLSLARFDLAEPYAVETTTLSDTDLYVAHRAMLAEQQDLSAEQSVTIDKFWVQCQKTASDPLFSLTGEAFNRLQPRNQAEDLLDRSVPLGR